jgi:hypothetical protein
MTSRTAEARAAPVALTQAAFRARCAARPASRDRVIDIARGIALVAILNTHFTLIARELGSLGGLRAPFLSDLQFPDFADFFVFLSGYVFGLVYGARLARDGFPAILRQTARRIGQIIRAMVVTIALAVALSWLLLEDRAALRTLDLLPFAENGRLALFDLVTFTRSPLFINILCLYVLLLLAAPFMVWGFARNIRATFGVSAVVWLLVQAGPLALTSSWAGVHSFNPFAWQLLFGLGVFLGMQRGFDTLIAALSRRAGTLLVLACALFLLFRLALTVQPGLATTLAPLIGKPEFAAIRLANFLCLAPVFVLFVAWLARAMPALAGWLARVGALSLEMFCAGVVLTFVMAVAFLELGGGIGAYAVVLAAGLVGYVLLVVVVEALS